MSLTWILRISIEEAEIMIRRVLWGYPALAKEFFVDVWPDLVEARIVIERGSSHDFYFLYEGGLSADIAYWAAQGLQTYETGRRTN